MEPGDVDADADELPSLVSAAGHLAARRGGRLRSPVQGRTAKPRPDHEILDAIDKRIASLYRNKIQVIDGRESKSASVAAELANLVAQRNALWSKLGPTQVLAGVVYQMRRDGKAYCFAPRRAWLGPFMRATNTTRPTFRGRLASRDLLLWLLWHFRDKALIQIGHVGHKVRGSRVDCPSCGLRHVYHRRPRDERGLSYCRRCGERTHRSVPDTPGFQELKLATITKAWLRRRFRVSRRTLDRILSVPLP